MERASHNLHQGSTSLVPLTAKEKIEPVMVPQRNLACTLQSRQAKGANQSTMKNPIGFKVMKWLVHVFNDALKAQRTHQQRDGKTRDQFGEIFRSKNKISNVLPNYFSIMLSKKFFVIKKPLDQFTTCSLWG